MLHFRKIIWPSLILASIGWIVWPRFLLRDGETLATITEVRGNTKLRAAGSFSWNSLRVGDSVFALDSVSTGSKSQARFRLKDGTEVRIPENTQLKIQPQVLAQGVSISLAKGGIEIQIHEESRSQTNTMSKNKNRDRKSPMVVQTSQLTIDLSRLKGSFRLKPNAAMETSQPDKIQIHSPQKTMNLAQLDKVGSVSMEEDMGQSIIDVEQVNLSDDSEVSSVEEEAPAPITKPIPKTPLLLKPVKKPPIAAVKQSESVSSPIAHFELANPEKLDFTKIKYSWMNFYWYESIAKGMELPLLIPVTVGKDESKSWHAIVRIAIAGQTKSVVIKRSMDQDRFFFSLGEIQTILPTGNVDGTILTLEPGLVRKTPDGRELHMSGIKSSLQVHSLVREGSLTVKLDQWRYVEPDERWFESSEKSEKTIALHLFDARHLPALEGYLKGSRSISLGPIDAVAQKASIHFIQGEAIILSVDELKPKILEDLRVALKPDLIFRGLRQKFLGRKKTFDPEHQIDQVPNIFYVRKNRTLVLDKSLFKTQRSARDLIKAIDPYFFREAVEIIFAKD